MGRSVNSGKIDKSYILSKVSQESIFSVYFDLPIDIIKHCLDTGELICSPIREDKHPTVGFKYNNRGQLKMKDFAGFFWGDCFDAVALILNQNSETPINISNKYDFIKVLKHITKTFSNIFYGKEKDPNLDIEIKSALNTIIKHKPNIEIVVREWNNKDKNYWDKFGVNLQYLNTNFVYPVEQYYIDRNINPEPKYYYSENDPCYAYFLGRDKRNRVSMKLYFPKREHGSTRFITNCNHLEGIYNLERNDYDYIIITKSTKDRLSLGYSIRSINSLYSRVENIKIGVINIPHETYKLRQVEFEWLRNKLNPNGILVSLMDNDKTGIIEAIYLKKTYNIFPIIIDKYLGVKDFAELREKYNLNQISEFINKTIKYVKESNEYNGNTKKSSIEPF